ncbi:hypothetical protein YDYSG_33850 [Paenibacillus tyrfis]|uniref:hypothetical protein n=1 Tax=Paenibacillus tyrfis TaxID=1501230 RepID=UPI002492DEA5|nr:hypothetical protein [Paenibacillus tyrfis]GLI07355.1 hypothetical protein YDYSG_33850 [Paenibacillus tyrfis]
MLKRIKLVIDSGNGNFEIVDAFVTLDKNHAYFISNGIVNYTMAARTQVERVYVECNVSIKLGETARGDVAIYDLHEKLNAMTAYQLLNFHVIHSLSDIGLLRED